MWRTKRLGMTRVKSWVSLRSLAWGLRREKEREGRRISSTFDPSSMRTFAHGIRSSQSLPVVHVSKLDRLVRTRSKVETEKGSVCDASKDEIVRGREGRRGWFVDDCMDDGGEVLGAEAVGAEEQEEEEKVSDEKGSKHEKKRVAEETVRAH